MSAVRRQAITRTNADILLIGSIGHVGINFNEIKIKIQEFQFAKIHLKISFACVCVCVCVCGGGGGGGVLSDDCNLKIRPNLNTLTLVTFRSLQLDYQFMCYYFIVSLIHVS